MGGGSSSSGFSGKESPFSFLRGKVSRGEKGEGNYKAYPTLDKKGIFHPSRKKES